MTTIHFRIDIQSHYPLKAPLIREWWPRMNANAALLTRELANLGIDTVNLAYHDSFRESDATICRLSLMPAAIRKKLRKSSDTRFDYCIAASDLVGVKGYYSAWAQPSIPRYIEENNITDIIFSGVFECWNAKYVDYNCVSKTAKDFSENKLNAVIASEATNVGVHRFADLDYRRKIHNDWNVEISPASDILKSLDSTYRPASTTFVSLYHPSV